MIFKSYDYQSSHEGCIDFEFHDLNYSKDQGDYGFPLGDWRELYELVIDSDYCINFGKWPVLFNDDDSLAMSKRRLKNLCKKMFLLYGDKESADKIFSDFELEFGHLNYDDEEIEEAITLDCPF